MDFSRVAVGTGRARRRPRGTGLNFLGSRVRVCGGQDAVRACQGKQDNGKLFTMTAPDGDGGLHLLLAMMCSGETKANYELFFEQAVKVPDFSLRCPLCPS